MHNYNNSFNAYRYAQPAYGFQPSYTTYQQATQFQSPYTSNQQYNNPYSQGYSNNVAYSPMTLLATLFQSLISSSVAGGYGQSNAYNNSGWLDPNTNVNQYDNSWNNPYLNNTNNSFTQHNNVFNNQNPVQDYLGQFGLDYNITNPLVKYTEAQTVAGAGTYDAEKTAYNVYDATGDINEIYELSGENSQYMIRNDKGPNAFDVREGQYKEVKLEDLGSDDIIVVNDTDQLKLKKHIKTTYGWEFHIWDQSTKSLITVHTRDQDQINNQTGNWESVDRDWDYVKERLVEAMPTEFSSPNATT